MRRDGERDGGIDLPTEEDSSAITVPCARCRRPVRVFPALANTILSACARLRVRAGADTLALCDDKGYSFQPDYEPGCYTKWQAEMADQAQRDHDTWTSLWRRFKARTVQYHELPVEMRDAWNNLLQAELRARNQTTGRRPPSSEDLR